MCKSVSRIIFRIILTKGKDKSKLNPLFITNITIKVSLFLGQLRNELTIKKKNVE